MLFSDEFTDNVDEGYRNLLLRRSPVEQALAETLEIMWARYESYADPDYRSGFARDPEGRFWEMFLGIALLDGGKRLLRTDERQTTGGQPDICVLDGGQRIWFEAIAPTEGDGGEGDIGLPEGYERMLRNAPYREIQLRISSALWTKTNRIREYRREGVIDEADISQIILDLRGNRGGLLSSAGEVTGQFIDAGVLLYERRRGNVQEEIVEDAYMIPKARRVEMNADLVVLVDGGTASASEIVAGAIQDHERGVLVGETTFGKGSMQYVHELKDTSSLHVTAAHWLTPNKRPINGVGLAADIEVGSTQEEVDGSLDPQLQRAISFLQEARQTD